MHNLKVGDVVRCVDGGTASVVSLYHHIPGGVVLSRYVGDFKSWNEDELTLVKRPTKEELQASAWYTWKHGG